jgi:tetratricopeptide (TPR) repeat protein
VCQGGRKWDRAAFSFSDLVCCRAIEKLEVAGLPTAKIRELLNLIEGRITDLDDYYTNRTVSIFADRVVISRKSHFVVSRAGNSLVRIDLEELIKRVEGSLSSQRPQYSAEQWLQEGIRQAASRSSTPLALAAFREALRLDPTLTDAYLLIGKLHYRERRLIDAERNFRLTLVRAPYNTEALYMLGRVMEDAGCLEEGIHYYEKVLEIEPHFKNAHYRLGKLYMELQFNERAQKHWEKYLALDPHSSRSATLRRYLEDLTVPAPD